MSESLEVLITPEDMQGLIHSAYVAGCAAVHANYQPDEDPDFTEAGYDYVASLDFTATTRPARAEGAKAAGPELPYICDRRLYEYGADEPTPRCPTCFAPPMTGSGEVAEALEWLVVVAAMEDAQGATNREAILKRALNFTARLSDKGGDR